MISLLPSDLVVGQALPWAVYDENNRLLLNKGAPVATERQRESLLLRGVYRPESEAEAVGPESRSPLTDDASPFDLLDDLIRRVPGIFRQLQEGGAQAGQRVSKLVGDLRELYARAPDAMLGAVHLCHEYPYTECHPVHSAILAEMMASRLGYSGERAHSLAAAALTQNITMLQLQMELQSQSEPLAPRQRAAVRAHPAQAVERLRAAGVTDALWLRTVLEHHENIDGSGYPRGLAGDAIAQEARLVGMADRYAAMISSRTYRGARDSKDALKDFYLNKGRHIDEQLVLGFIQEIGVYPPGSFVRLNNGEVGVVIKRGPTGTQPLVASYVSPRGVPYARPLRRDCAVPGIEVRQTCRPDTGIPIRLGALWAV